MRGKSHFFISAFLTESIALLAFHDTAIHLAPVPLIIGGICALVPDIDEPNSKISRKLIGDLGGKQTDNPLHNKMIRFERQCALTGILAAIGYGCFYFKLYPLTLVVLYLAALPWAKHRGISHTIISTLIVGGLSILALRNINIYYGWYIAIGYFLHLVEDTFTVSGVAYFYPFSKKRYKIPLMSTGTKKGAVVETIFIAISFVICFLSYFGMGLV